MIAKNLLCYTVLEGSKQTNKQTNENKEIKEKQTPVLIHLKL